MAELPGGRLLVANPLLPDPNFERTVVLVLAAGEDGAIGVVLNRPTDTPVGEVIPEWASAASPPGVVFSGGPVEPGTIIGLARPKEDSAGDDMPGWKPIAGGLGTIDLDSGPGPDPGPGGVDPPGDPAEGDLGPVRIFAGYAGWGAGQLEAELEAEAWWVVAADVGDAFDSDPGRLWTSVLRRQKGPLQLVSSFPEDPADN